jgi:hypothetical protein
MKRSGRLLWVLCTASMAWLQNGSAPGSIQELHQQHAPVRAVDPYQASLGNLLHVGAFLVHLLGAGEHSVKSQSGRQDSNLRPSAPKALECGSSGVPAVTGFYPQEALLLLAFRLAGCDRPWPSVPS